MNIRYLPIFPLAALAAVAVAWVLYAEERQRQDNPVSKWFSAEDEFLSHLPHPWSITATYYKGNPNA